MLDSDTRQSFTESALKGEVTEDLWALAGELASPNFEHQGEWFARARYEFSTVNGHKIVTRRYGVPHGLPQADTISANEAIAKQRRIYGQLRAIEAEAIRRGQPDAAEEKAKRKPKP